MISRSRETERGCDRQPKYRPHSRRQPHDICIIPGCGRPYHSRGLCDTCRTSARRAVNRGETTWEELVELGLALPHVPWWNNPGSGVRWSKLHKALRDAREVADESEGTIGKSNETATQTLSMLTAESFLINRRVALRMEFGVGVDVVASPLFSSPVIVDRVVPSPHARKDS